MFFGGFLLFGIIRELIVRFTFSPYTFEAFNPIFQLINIPVAIGWAFAGYISYWFCRWIFLQFNVEKTAFNNFLIACCTAAFVSLIVFAIEFTAPRMGWWSYNPQIDPIQPNIFGVYLFLFMGWSGTILAFLIPFQLNYHAKEFKISKKLRLSSLFIIPAFYISLVTGNYFLLTESLISFYIFFFFWIPFIFLFFFIINRRRRS